MFITVPFHLMKYTIISDRFKLPQSTYTKGIGNICLTRSCTACRIYVTFEQIVELYLFNANFRQLIFPEIEKVEINDEIKRNSKAPFVRNFRENYVGGQLPIYALVEVFSFGTLSKFFKNMTNMDKKSIASTFGVGYTYFESWLESISYVRNICAHYGRIYNAKLSKTPILYKEYSSAGIGNNRIFGVLLCLKYLLKKDEHWKLFVERIELLFEKYENVSIKTMGFPDNWKALLEE